jgi:translation elongation factor EF-Tu-like GTPase
MELPQWILEGDLEKLKAEEQASRERIEKLLADCELEHRKIFDDCEKASEINITKYRAEYKKEKDRMAAIQVAFHADYFAQMESRQKNKPRGGLDNDSD